MIDRKEESIIIGISIGVPITPTEALDYVESCVPCHEHGVWCSGKRDWVHKGEVTIVVFTIVIVRRV